MVMAPTQTPDASAPPASPMDASSGGGAGSPPPGVSPDSGGMAPAGAPPAPGGASSAGGMSGTQGGNPGDQDAQASQIQQALQQKIASLSPDDQKFLQAHMTSEFVHAIGLINGPIVENYLQKFVDPNKVMVPIPRQAAEQLAKQQQQKMQQGGQGSPAPAQGATPSAPPPAQGASPATSGGGMMSPAGS